MPCKTNSNDDLEFRTPPEIAGAGISRQPERGYLLNLALGTSPCKLGRPQRSGRKPGAVYFRIREGTLSSVSLFTTLRSRPSSYFNGVSRDMLPVDLTTYCAGVC